MSKNTVFTTITPLGIMPREIVIEAIHDHLLMIDLNPLVEERHAIDPPKNASPEEYHCKWYQITDKITYIPGGVAKGKVSYNACFHDLANGLQTHVYAPLGLDIRSKWLVGGSLPGEPLETAELGLDIPKEGLYLREDVNMRCNILMTSFVKKNLKRSHATLKGRLVERAHKDHRKVHNDRLSALTAGSQTSLQSSLAPSIAPSVASQQIPQQLQGLGPAPGQVPGYPQQQQQGQYPPGVLPQIQPGSPFNPGQFPTGAFVPPQGYDPRLSTSSHGSSNPYSPQPFPGSGNHQQIDPAYQNMNPYHYPQGAVPSPPIPGQHIPYQYAQQYPAVGPGGIILPPGYVVPNVPQQRAEVAGDLGFQGQDQKGVVPQQGTPTPGQQQSPYPPPQPGQPQQHVHHVQQQGPVELA